mmetsp:Transcript_27533/g.77175  ORF Transcript_27533/g.77175 Transcript_27533/m.77175 type:complete len:229 (+) Transcript_27533:130-816(+)
MSREMHVWRAHFLLVCLDAGVVFVDCLLQLLDHFEDADAVLRTLVPGKLDDIHHPVLGHAALPPSRINVRPLPLHQPLLHGFVIVEVNLVVERPQSRQETVDVVPHREYVAFFIQMIRDEFFRTAVKPAKVAKWLAVNLIGGTVVHYHRVVKVVQFQASVLRSQPLFRVRVTVKHDTVLETVQVREALRHFQCHLQLFPHGEVVAWYCVWFRIQYLLVDEAVHGDDQI